MRNHRFPWQLSCSVQSVMRQPNADAYRLDSQERQSPNALLFLSALKSTVSNAQ
jgi:hypothetical protein